MRVGQALAQARALGVARLDAQLLLAARLGRPRAWLIAHDDEALPADTEAAYVQDLAQRAAGRPLAHLLGEREFRGLTLTVTPQVLVPRPETELLVDWALQWLQMRPPGAQAARVVDLGTGSGAIALALVQAWPRAQVTATDVDPAALAVAGGNASRLGLALECIAGNWWEPLAGRVFDLVLSNPPYIAGDDPHLAALAHEPRHALTPEGDGLGALRAIVASAPSHLAPGGALLLEHGYDQGAAVRALLADHGFASIETRRDLAGHERCTGGMRGP